MYMKGEAIIRICLWRKLQKMKSIRMQYLAAGWAGQSAFCCGFSCSVEAARWIWFRDWQTRKKPWAGGNFPAVKPQSSQSNELLWASMELHCINLSTGCKSYRIVCSFFISFLEWKVWHLKWSDWCIAHNINYLHRQTTGCWILFFVRGLLEDKRPIRR